MGRVLFPLGGVLLVLVFMVYAKSRMPLQEPADPAAQPSDDETSTAGDLPEWESEGDPAKRRTASDRGSDSNDPQENARDDSRPSTSDDARDARRAPAGDPGYAEDPRSRVSEDPRGEGSERVRQQRAFADWVSENRKAEASFDEIAKRVRDGDAAAAQVFNDAADARAQALIDEFGIEVAEQYARRIPIHKMDVETGERIRIDHLGRAFVEDDRKRR